MGSTSTSGPKVSGRNVPVYLWSGDAATLDIHLGLGTAFYLHLVILAQNIKQ